uniref:Uncharacterized protein n=1 Tax=viral metagenome TaxID=1070528 RepID=A0A6M3IHZ9_9ZZZZ
MGHTKPRVKVAKLIWVDITSHSGHYPADEAVKHVPTMFATIGIVIKETKRYLHMSSMVQESGCADPFIIPKGCILWRKDSLWKLPMPLHLEET